MFQSIVLAGVNLAILATIFAAFGGISSLAAILLIVLGASIVVIIDWVRSRLE